MVDIVRRGKVWEITCEEDFQKAWKALDESEFIANMSDDYQKTREELHEIAKQRYQVAKAARELGIL